MIRLYHTVGMEDKKHIECTANTLEELEKKVIKDYSSKDVVHYYSSQGYRETTTIPNIDLNKIKDYWILLSFDNRPYRLEIV